MIFASYIAEHAVVIRWKGNCHQFDIFLIIFKYDCDHGTDCSTKNTWWQYRLWTVGQFMYWVHTVCYPDAEMLWDSSDTLSFVPGVRFYTEVPT